MSKSGHLEHELLVSAASHANVLKQIQSKTDVVQI